MKNNLAIIGKGGHSKVVAEIASLCDWINLIFFDDFDSSLPNVEDFYSDAKKFDAVFVAIGNNDIRLEIIEECKKRSIEVANLIHPSAIISSSASLGVGIVIMPMAVVNAASKIGDGCILNTSCSVDHDCVLSSCVHISPGAHLAGGVSVGTKSWIGIGACVKEKITIGENIQIGAGGVVVADLEFPGLYKGVPVKKAKNF